MTVTATPEAAGFPANQTIDYSSWSIENLVQVINYCKVMEFCKGPQLKEAGYSTFDPSDLTTGELIGAFNYCIDNEVKLCNRDAEIMPVYLILI